jgi:hypothetical protein
MHDRFCVILGVISYVGWCATDWFTLSELTGLRPLEPPLKVDAKS